MFIRGFKRLGVKSPSTLEELIEALRCLPGVGPKSSQRMTYYLLQHDRQGAARLSTALATALSQIQHCQKCNSFTEDAMCDLCASANRDATTLCVIEMPADLMMMEQTQVYRGLYFVLMGRLSPLDGIGPKELYLDRLIKRASDGVVKEVLLATNFTVEGEATAHYIGELLKEKGIRVTRIARGVPVGGELEHTDTGTLAQAVLERREVS